MDAYEQRELNRVYKRLSERQTLGKYWCDDIAVDSETCVNRIHWLLDGSYGFGEMLHAKNMITRYTENKKGKNLDKGFLSAARELTILVALYDTTDINARKISDIWKKQCIDFAAINEMAKIELLAWVEAQNVRV